MPRELVQPHRGEKRYVRRKAGKFTSRQVNVGRSLAVDRRSAIQVKDRGEKG
jgi:hypothetical protein